MCQAHVHHLHIDGTLAMGTACSYPTSSTPSPTPPIMKLPQEYTIQRHHTSHIPRTMVLKQKNTKKGAPWTEEEHVAFLQGLQIFGKGQWKQISRYHVPTRTPTQVASHAQKHFLRLSGGTKRRSRFTAVEESLMVSTSTHSEPHQSVIKEDACINTSDGLNQNVKSISGERGPENRSTTSASAMTAPSSSTTQSNSMSLNCVAVDVPKNHNFSVSDNVFDLIMSPSGFGRIDSNGVAIGIPIQDHSRNVRRHSRFLENDTVSCKSGNRLLATSSVWTRTPSGSYVPLLPVLPGRIAATMICSQSTITSDNKMKPTLTNPAKLSKRTEKVEASQSELDTFQTNTDKPARSSLRLANRKHSSEKPSSGVVDDMADEETRKDSCQNKKSRKMTVPDGISALDALAGIAAVLSTDVGSNN